MGIDRWVGLDLAWRESRPGLAANETGVAVLDPDGRVVDAGWTRGLDETAERVAAKAGESALLFIDAPLVVDNPSGQRACETQVGQRYWRWKVSANTTNLRSPRLAGVALRRDLENQGWRYSDGHSGPPADGRSFCECYPYTTLVGAPELGYDLERPRYKRKPRRMPTAQWRPIRRAACDDLVQRLTRFAGADPPLSLDSHPVTRQLAAEPSPLNDAAYKHREDLIDAVLCAWTAAFGRSRNRTVPEQVAMMGRQFAGRVGLFLRVNDFDAARDPDGCGGHRVRFRAACRAGLGTMPACRRDAPVDTICDWSAGTAAPDRAETGCRVRVRSEALDRPERVARGDHHRFIAARSAEPDDGGRGIVHAPAGHSDFARAAGGGTILVPGSSLPR